jgi:AraC-like DNA-binding protein
VLTQPGAKARHFLWHCIPAGLLLLVLAPFFALPAEQKLAVLEREWQRSGFNLADSPPLLVLIAQIGVYLTLCFIRIRRYHRALGEFYSNVEKRRIDWLWMTLAGALALFTVWLIWLATQTRWSRALDATGFPIVVYLLGYFGLRQPQVPSQPTTPVAPQTRALDASAATAQAQKYEKSALSTELAQQYRARIDAYCALEKPYLESDLTLAELAQRLSMPPHHLSQVLNAHIGQSFFDFINQRRVEEVKRCLHDPHYAAQTILEIGLASGFSSKATFNAAFKKFTGVTPSQYRTHTLNCIPL